MPGVARVDVALDDEGSRGVVRVVVDRDADKSTVTNDARRVLRLAFGSALDPGVLLVTEDDDVSPPPTQTGLRLVENRADDDTEADSAGAGSDVEAFLEAIDGDAEQRFDAPVLASAIRHPAGGASSVVPAPGPRRSPSPSGPWPARPRRVVVGGLRSENTGLDAVCTVTLFDDGRELTGSARSVQAPSSLYRAVSLATLRALTGLLPDGLRLDVDAVAILALGDGEAAVVRVAWVTSEGSDHVTGASDVRHDPRDAVIRATLDAVNDRLHVELPE